MSNIFHAVVMPGEMEIQQILNMGTSIICEAISVIYCTWFTKVLGTLSSCLNILIIYNITFKSRGMPVLSLTPG